uniref:Uncharacterized protein n=1 Tax=Vespula pensylvanica TaxID=30213 RepID=A0A834P1B5_VESPE|nr:hypothetical protein H0235_009179 [Vespula pensylvanica]
MERRGREERTQSPELSCEEKGTQSQNMVKQKFDHSHYKLPFSIIPCKCIVSKTIGPITSFFRRDSKYILW